MTTTFLPKKSLFAAATMVLLWLAFPFYSFGATANVAISSFAFTPPASTINAGDQVTWTWNGTSHSTTSDTSLWNSGVRSSGTFSQTFNSPGTFPYHCSLHSFMTASITVNAAASPPTLSITNPANNALFIAPANVTIQVTVTNGSSAVTNVQFRVGSNTLTNETSAPFSATTNNLAAGSYSLSAIATDNNGLKATNSVSIIVDTPPTVTITNPPNNATLSAPANVTVQAGASDSDAGGSVTNVQFLVGSIVLMNQTAAPFFATTNSLAAGSYTFSAVASDNLGVKATNAVTISVVTPVQTTFGGLQTSSPTNFQFSYAANTGLTYIVQLSTNLASTNWITLATNTAASNPAVFTDNHATNNPGFYRVGRLPNP